MVYYKQEEQGNMYSKQSYNYGRHGSKRRLKSIPVIITLLVVILILGGIYFLLFNEKNKYEDYNTYNETNKQYGTVQHYEKENDDFYISLYYPKLKEKNYPIQIKILVVINTAGFSILPTTMMTIRQNYHSQNILAFYPYSLFIGFSITIIGIVIIKVIEHV